MTIPKHRIFVRFGDTGDFCDYANDLEDLYFLLREYRIAYGNNCEFKVIPNHIEGDVRHVSSILS